MTDAAAMTPMQIIATLLKTTASSAGAAGHLLSGIGQVERIGSVHKQWRRYTSTVASSTIFAFRRQTASTWDKFDAACIRNSKACRLAEPIIAALIKSQ